LSDSTDDGASPPGGEAGAPALGGLGRRVTLSSLQPLRLPAASEKPATAVAPVVGGDAEVVNDNAGRDAWTKDRIRRSSLPPAGAPGSTRPIPPSGRPPRGLPAAGEAEPLRESTGDALDLVSRSSSSVEPIDLAEEMAERFALDDFTGSLRVAELVLGQDPEDEMAEHYARASRGKLEELLYSRLTAEGSVPVVVVDRAEVRWLGLEASTAFLLSLADGHLDCDSIVDASGMTRLEALKGLLQLLDARVAEIRPGRGR